jgi:hypothetical protein
MITFAGDRDMFISIGLAYLDVNRAVTEPGTLPAARWSDDPAVPCKRCNVASSAFA